PSPHPGGVVVPGDRPGHGPDRGNRPLACVQGAAIPARGTWRRTGHRTVMTCNEVENWMLADETPNRPSEEVRRHLRSCAGCRERFGRLVRLIHEVHTAPMQPIPPATRAHIV